jgi:hypothetical protein
MKTPQLHLKTKVALLLLSFVLFLILSFLASFRAQAQTEKPEIVTDRPDQTEAPVLVPKGALQIEMGFVYEKDNEQDVNEINYTYNTTLIKYGINDNFELRFLTEYLGQKSAISEQYSSSVRGLAPFAIGMKIKLADEKGFWPQAALLGHISTHTGSDELDTRYTAADFRLTFEHKVSKKIVIGYNFGAEWNGETPEAIFLYTFTGSYSVTKKLAVYVETYSFFPEHSKPDHRFDAGLMYKFSPVVQWDVSAGVGLNKIAPDSYLSTGISFRLFK